MSVPPPGSGGSRSAQLRPFHEQLRPDPTRYRVVVLTSSTADCADWSGVRARWHGVYFIAAFRNASTSFPQISMP
jgi:hypothetical protein